jgi:hypothetical protein
MSLRALPSPRAAEPKSHAAAGAGSHSPSARRIRSSNSQRILARASIAGAARWSRLRRYR